MLTNARRFDVTSGTYVQAPARMGDGIEPIQFTLASVDPNEQNFWELRDSIDKLESAGRSIRSAESPPTGTTSWATWPGW